MIPNVLLFTLGKVQSLPLGDGELCEARWVDGRPASGRSGRSPESTSNGGAWEVAWRQAFGITRPGGQDIATLATVSGDHKVDFL